MNHSSYDQFCRVSVEQDWRAIKKWWKGEYRILTDAELASLQAEHQK